MPESERDIDLVLVTGAGASRAFGINNKPLPLMEDWSHDLVQRLRRRSQDYLAATGLDVGMGAEEFERQLGEFLRSVDAFKRIGHLLPPISSAMANLTPQANGDEWKHWHLNAVGQLDQIIAIIYESLYALFGGQVDMDSAGQAYDSLFRVLGIRITGDNPTRWVYATTNYDTIGEEVIARHHGLPDIGEAQMPRIAAERPIRVEHLLAGMPRYVPVLHLHGRVGWFRREEGAYSTQMDGYARENGTPIVMLPDLEKIYETDQVIGPLWQQFKQALSRARRVLVLGHSLHDKELIRALVENIEPLDRLAVTFLTSQQQPTQADDSVPSSFLEVVREKLPTARLIPMRFEAGVDLVVGDGLGAWMEDDR